MSGNWNPWVGKRRRVTAILKRLVENGGKRKWEAGAHRVMGEKGACIKREPYVAWVTGGEWGVTGA